MVGYVLKEKLCPIFRKTIRSDAEIFNFCKLCGKGILVSLSIFKLEEKGGNVVYFCCNRCLSIYKTEIKDNKEG